MNAHKPNPAQVASARRHKDAVALVVNSAKAHRQAERAKAARCDNAYSAGSAFGDAALLLGEVHRQAAEAWDALVQAMEVEP